MKKVLALVLVGAMLFCFAACSKSTNNEEAKNTESTTTQSNKNNESGDKTGNAEPTTSASSSSNKGTTNDASNGVTGFTNSNEISEAPKGAVVASNLKANKCKANIQSLPVDVQSKYLPSRKTKTKSTLKKCTYSFVDDTENKNVILKLNISGTKRDDAENGTLSCGFTVKIFDSKNNLVGKVSALTPKTENGKDFEYSCSIGGLTDTQYSIAFADVEG